MSEAMMGHCMMVNCRRHAPADEAMCIQHRPKETMTIGADWIPTAECINALPKPLRQYIHDLETMADPAGIIQENALLQDQTRQLDAMIARLKRGGSTDG